jgi:type II secretory pathway component PulK
MYAKNQSKQKGIALIVAMLFEMVFSALSVAMFSMSSGNSLVASNLHKVNAARSSAESGLEIVRYYLAQVEIDGDVSEDQWFPRATSKILDLSGVNFVEQSADLRKQANENLCYGERQQYYTKIADRFSL